MQLGFLRATFMVRIKGADRPVPVYLAFDHAPEFISLEEGSQRLGLRVKFQLYDSAQNYHGHGSSETWLYPNGEVFVTFAASFEDASSREAVTDARLSLFVPQYTAATVAAPESKAVRLDTLKAPLVVPFTDPALPGHQVTLSSGALPELALYWRSGGMEFSNYIYREQKNAPTYYRWPSYLTQAHMGGILPKAVQLIGSGTPADGSVVRPVTEATPAVEFVWTPEGAEPLKSATPTFFVLFRLASGRAAEMATQLVQADREPIKLAAQGGVIHGNLDGYNDQEGAYEVRKTANPLSITLPADPLHRRVTIKAIGLSGHGAVVTKLDGKPIVPQLIAEGGIADDPLAPIREQPEGPADMAVVTAMLTDKPQTLTVSEEDGVQFAYQTRDPWRNVACFSTKGGGRYAGLKFSLVDGRIRNMRAYGQREWALTENLMHWFSYCGFTPEQMLNQLADFQILKNGPDEAIFRYVSTNANARAQSEYLVRVPASSPAMQINVRATFSVLQSWPYDSSQFFDVFPFRGVWPQDWWYDEVLWLAPDGRTKWMRTVERTYEGDQDLAEITGGGFFALAHSDRGNMVMLTKNFKPVLPTSYVICGNYIDYHMELKFKGPDGKVAPPSKGFTAGVEYDLALWGDAKTSRDDLLKLGKESIAAGRLALPAR